MGKICVPSMFYMALTHLSQIYIVSRFVTRNSKSSKPRAPISSHTSPSTSTLHVSPLHAFLTPEADEAEGITTNCMTLSTVCFKHGPSSRLTVPPALVFGMSGFNGIGGDKMGEMKSMRMDRKRLTSYMKKGAWRNLPEGERWWEIVDPEVQAKVSSALAALKGGL